MRARSGSPRAAPAPPSGHLVLRNDDLDATRFRMDFARAMVEDMRWIGLSWDEGPDIGGPDAPTTKASGGGLYRAALEKLQPPRLIYPCARSRRDVLEAAGAPHEGERSRRAGLSARIPPGADAPARRRSERGPRSTGACGFREARSWPSTDGNFGPQRAVAHRDFGDFPVWRRDDCPSYQLACAVDDAAMGITEVVRGADLIRCDLPPAPALPGAGAGRARGFSTAR